MNPTRFLIAFSLISFKTFAGECINPKDALVPTCPTQKTNALDDTFPAAFVMIGPGQSDPMGTEVAIKAFFAGGPTRLVLSGWKATQVTALKQTLAGQGVTSAQIEEHILDFSDGTPYQWQQDYIQPEFNSITGAPVIRPINAYLSERLKQTGSTEKAYYDKFDLFLKNQKVFCGVGPTIGNPLGEPVTDSIAFGGNMEGFPGGLCLIGSTLPEASFKDFCKGKEEFALKIPTHFLEVGHVDEVVTVVKDLSAKAPCDFAVLRASPAKAIELLKDSDASLFQKLLPTDQKQYTDDAVYDAWIKFKVAHPEIPESEKARTLRGSQNLIRFLMPTSLAETSVNGRVVTPYKFREEVATLTNREAYYAITRNHDLNDFNAMVDAELMKAEGIIKQKASAMGCPNIKIIPVPSLFQGTIYSSRVFGDPLIETILINGQKFSKKLQDITDADKDLMTQPERMRIFDYRIQARSGKAINPNPTNALSLNHSLIFPDQKNSVFSNYLNTKVAAELGLKSESINTWSSAHIKTGNLHCSINAIRYCRPQ